MRPPRLLVSIFDTHFKFKYVDDDVMITSPKRKLSAGFAVRLDGASGNDAGHETAC